MRVKNFDRLSRQEKDYLLRRAEETRRGLIARKNEIGREIDKLTDELRETNSRIEDAKVAIDHLRQ